MSYLVNKNETPLKLDKEFEKWIRIEEDKQGNLKYILQPMKLSAYLKEHSNFIFVRNEATQRPFTYCYLDGYYQLFSDEEIMAFIKRYIPQDLISSREIREILFDLKTQLKFVDFDKLNEDEDLINFQDGFLNVKTGEFFDHTPDILSTVQIPAKYKDIQMSDGNAPVFDKYMDTLTDGNSEVYSLLLQCLGLAISNIPCYKTKKSLFLVGNGDTGKSQIKKLAEELIGSQNVSVVDLKKVNEKFGAASLYQKRLSGCNDMSYQRVTDMSIFKQLTGGDKIEIEFKNKDTFTFTYKGFLWFNCNKLPRFGGDTGKWVYDRIMPVYCNNVIPPEKRDPELFNKMWKEKNAILKKALDALQIVIGNGYKFIEPSTMIKAREEYEVDNSTFLTFMEECCEIKPDVMASFRLRRSTFRQAYDQYVKINCNNFGKISTYDMNRILKEKYNENYVKSNGKWFMEKIVLLPEAKEELNIYENNYYD